MSYSFGKPHWAAAHVISMLAAFSAGVAVYSYRTFSDEVPGWQVGHCYRPPPIVLHLASNLPIWVECCRALLF